MKTSTITLGSGLIIPSLFFSLAGASLLSADVTQEFNDANYKYSLTRRILFYTMMAAPPIHIVAWMLAYKKETNLFFLLDAIPPACLVMRDSV